MKDIKVRLLSLAMIVAVLVSTSSFAFAFDEGMFAPAQIAGLPLTKRGMKIKPNEIYNPGGVGLTDAVIRLSIGCTAEFVSPDGLILTNHHCGFDALVKASTPEKDLVETGFKTESRAGEIAAKDYSIFITNREEDVTARVKAGTEGLTGAALADASKKNSDAVAAAEQAKNLNADDKAKAGSAYTARLHQLKAAANTIDQGTGEIYEPGEVPAIDPDDEFLKGLEQGQ